MKMLSACCPFFGRRTLREKVEVGLGLGDGDCFNDLPNDLLVHILSFLSAEEAVRTSTLSKRWKRLWVGVPSLTINENLDILESAMGLHASPNGKVAWITLRVLDVANATWTDDLVAKLLAGCPALESLRLCRFKGITRIDATFATKLKKLVMVSCLVNWRNYYEYFDGDCELSICAPHLRELKLTGLWLGFSPVLISVDSLVKAEIDFTIDGSRNKARKVLGMVRQCEELHVSLYFLEDLSSIENDPFRASLSSPKHVIIGYCNSFNSLGIYNLFQCYPTLERLTLNLSCMRDQDLTWPPSCLLSNLKVVKLDGLVISGACVVKFAEFLLKNSPILEKMVIWSYVISSSDRESLLKTVGDLPRSSPRAIIMGRHP